MTIEKSKVNVQKAKIIAFLFCNSTSSVASYAIDAYTHFVLCALKVHGIPN